MKEVLEFLNNIPKKTDVVLTGSLNYEALKREHVKLAEEVNRLIKLLQKDGTYDQLMVMAAESGLDTELKNADEVIAKLLQKWSEDKTALHIFITLIETSKHKKAIEKKLEEMRLRTSMVSAQISNSS